MSGGSVKPEPISTWTKGPSYPSSGHSPSLLCNNLSVARYKGAARESGLYAFASGHLSVMASRANDEKGKDGASVLNVQQLTLMRFSSSSKYFMPITQVSHVMLDGERPIWVACGVFGAMINSGWEKQVIIGKLRMETAKGGGSVSKKNDWFADEFLRGICGGAGVLYLGHSSGEILRCTLPSCDEWPTLQTRKKEKEDDIPDDQKKEVEVKQLPRLVSPSHTAAIMDLHCRGNTLISTDENGVIIAWELDGHGEAKVVAVNTQWRPHVCITARIIPGVNLVAAAFKTGHIRLLRPTDLTCAVEICAHAKTMTALDVARNRIVSAGEDSYCRIWCVQETAPGKYRVEQEHYVFAEDGVFTGVGFSSDNAESYYMSMYDLPGIPSGNRVTRRVSTK